MRDGLALFDMHLHLDSYGQPVAVARELDALGVGALAVTTTPRGYERNAELARRLLAEAGIAIVAEDLGGRAGRKLRFRTEDGMALVKTLRAG